MERKSSNEVWQYQGIDIWIPIGAPDPLTKIVFLISHNSTHSIP